MKRIRTIPLLIIGCLIACSAAWAGSAVRMNVNLNVRTGPSTAYAVIGGATAGQLYAYEGTQSGWYKIRYDNRIGYVSGGYGNSTITSANLATVTLSSGLNVRTGPGINYQGAGVIYAGQRFVMTGSRSGTWIQFYHGGNRRWASGNYMNQENTPQPPGPDCGSRLARPLPSFPTINGRVFSFRWSAIPCTDDYHYRITGPNNFSISGAANGSLSVNRTLPTSAPSGSYCVRIVAVGGPGDSEWSASRCRQYTSSNCGSRLQRPVLTSTSPSIDSSRLIRGYWGDVPCRDDFHWQLSGPDFFRSGAAGGVPRMSTRLPSTAKSGRYCLRVVAVGGPGDSPWSYTKCVTYTAPDPCGSRLQTPIIRVGSPRIDSTRLVRADWSDVPCRREFHWRFSGPGLFRYGTASVPRMATRLPADAQSGQYCLRVVAVGGGPADSLWSTQKCLTYTAPNPCGSRLRKPIILLGSPRIDSSRNLSATWTEVPCRNDFHWRLSGPDFFRSGTASVPRMSIQLPSNAKAGQYCLRVVAAGGPGDSLWSDQKCATYTPPEVIPHVDNSWAFVAGGARVTQIAGRPTLAPSARPIGAGPLVIAGLVGELVVQYFQTFDLDRPFIETQVAHLFPMVLDRPGDDLELTVSKYDFLPWVEPQTKPYRNDPDECIAHVNAVAGAMLAMIDRRATHPEIRNSASLAVAMYCIDGKIGGASARSGGLDKVPEDMPGLAVNPNLPQQHAAFYVRNPIAGTSTTPQEHAETNLLGALIEGVPILRSSVGEIFMLVDNPSEGRICDRCVERLEAFQKRFPSVRLTVIARNNAFQEGNTINTNPINYDRILRFE